jgi:hypothetical protein
VSVRLSLLLQETITPTLSTPITSVKRPPSTTSLSDESDPDSDGWIETQPNNKKKRILKPRALDQVQSNAFLDRTSNDEVHGTEFTLLYSVLIFFSILLPLHPTNLFLISRVGQRQDKLPRLGRAFLVLICSWIGVMKKTTLKRLGLPKIRLSLMAIQMTR